MIWIWEIEVAIGVELFWEEGRLEVEREFETDAWRNFALRYYGKGKK